MVFPLSVKSDHCDQTARASRVLDVNHDYQDTAPCTRGLSPVLSTGVE
jgi:hypothetical protein